MEQLGSNCTDAKVKKETLKARKANHEYEEAKTWPKDYC
jgi:hypothetical protein